MITTMARPSGPPVSMFSRNDDELDVEMVQLVEHFEQVLHRASHAIEGPDHHDIEAAAAGVEEQLVQSRTLRLGAGDAIGVLLRDLIATLRDQRTQVMKLGLGMLIEGRYAHIQGRRASSLALQVGDLVAHLDDGIVKEAEAGQAGGGPLSLQEPFQLEELYGRAYVLDLLVEL